MFNKLIIGTDTSPAARTLLDCVNGFKQFGTNEVVLVESSNLSEGSVLPATADKGNRETTLEEQKRLLELNGFHVETKLINEPLKKTITALAEEDEKALIIVGAEKQSRTRDMLFGGLAYDIIHHTGNPVLILRLYKPEESHKLRNCDFGSHILFPTDFSQNAERAFNFLEKLVMTEADKVTLVHVWQEQPLYETTDDPMNPMPNSEYVLQGRPTMASADTRLNDIPNSEYPLQGNPTSGTGINVILKDRAEKLLSTMKQRLIAAKPDLEVDTLILEGNPFQQIRHLVEEMGISLVIMGSQGTGYISDLFVGSLTHNIVRNVDSSVLLIPAGHTRAQRTDVRERIGR